MRMIITGPPGAGKGTMARAIQEDFNIPIISTGDILRQEIKNETELGLIVKELIEKGDFVSNEIVVKIIQNFTKDMLGGYLLDGFPRNLAQAIEFNKMLEDTNSSIDVVINIDVDDEVLIDRVKGRLICPKCTRSYHITYAKPNRENYCDFCGVLLEKRIDDTEEYARHRLEVYHTETEPLIEYYREKGILFNIASSVDDINETHEKLKEILETYN